MKLTILTPQKSLNKAYLKQSLKREQIDLFRANLARMFERIRTDEHEEHLKNVVSDFLKDTWYKQTNEINTSGRTDLVIHNGTSSKDTVGVLLEVKRPGNSAEMISHDKPNTKALHELLHYYMQERYIKGNLEVKRLIVCNIYEWYIFDAADFERLFFQNKKFVESYQKWSNGLFSGDKTEWLYKEILKPFVEGELDNLPCTYFNLKEYERIVRNPARAEDNKLIALYKVLSPPHLLKQPFANDSNSLNREFYSELLHIIGLEEVKEKGKKLIRRKPEGARNDGSLLENTITILKTRGRLANLANPQQYGADADEQQFSVALELCITWLNRLLFLKLLEGQLIAYHKGDRSHAFLNSSRIDDFDELNELFFEVLAVRVDERSQSVREKFGNIPYLNSSLFEESELERSTIRISELKNRLDLPLFSSTVLKASSGKRITGSKNTLNYLFEFLDAYDFGAEGSAEIQEQNKSIINASVLGLIFEKINGYRDGSFFTPGFITMYICRETIQRAVLHKFNEAYGWNCADLVELHNEIIRQRIPVKDANALINALKICDPAVGSGHFLVSALNEIIAIKSQLRILADRDGRLLRCEVAVENDELIVTVDDRIFEYNFNDAESQRIQETLFHEKETIIENCLFGVDINPKSVAICRLRLWIELLKNAYYRRNSDQLETLPNIDINIKCGNSLVSRFALAGMPTLPAAGRKKQKELADKYRELVFFYKHAPSNKAEVRKQIENLKHALENFGLPNDKDLIALRKKENELAQLGFAFDKKGTETRQKLMKEVEALQARFAEKERLLYSNAFEWRFEFPEVLDDAGEFIGFDAVIGNPPYIRIQDIKEYAPQDAAFQKEHYRSAAKGNYDIYVVFVERGLSLLRKQGLLSYILSHKFFNSQYGEPLRRIIATGQHLSEVVHFGEHQVFEEATTYTCMLFLNRSETPAFHLVRITDLLGWKAGNKNTLLERTISAASVTASEWNFAVGENVALFERLKAFPITLGTVADIFVGLQTSADKVFILDLIEETDYSLRLRSKALGREWTFEKDLLHPLVSGTDIKRFAVLPTRQYILFPYQVTVEGVELISFDVIETQWPQTAKYLLANRETLESREKGKFRDKHWFRFGRNQNLGIQQKVKLMIPRLVDQLYASYDACGRYFLDNVDVGGITPKPETGIESLFLLGLFNSALLRWFFPQVSAPFRGGWLSANRQYLTQLPMPPLELPYTKDQQAPIIERVQQILDAPDSPEVPRLEAEIDQLVYTLYGLTDEEIALVEGVGRAKTP